MLVLIYSGRYFSGSGHVQRKVRIIPAIFKIFSKKNDNLLSTGKCKISD